MKKLALAIAAAFTLSGVAVTASAQSHDHGMHSGGSWHGGGHSGGDWHGGDHGNWHGGWHGGWHGDHHDFRGPRFGFSFGFPAYPYWGPSYGYYGYPYPYAYPYEAYPYYYDSGPQVYIQRDSGGAVAPANPARPSDYSYYCTDPAGYYPQVASCPSGWLKVVPNSPPPR